MSDDHERVDVEQPMARSLAATIAAGASTITAAATVANVYLQNRPPKPEPPKVELPPGAQRD